MSHDPTTEMVQRISWILTAILFADFEDEAAQPVPKAYYSHIYQTFRDNLSRVRAVSLSLPLVPEAKYLVSARVFLGSFLIV